MEGVARRGGLVAFVPFTDIGERVRARVSHINKSYVFAEAVEVFEPSKFRVKPPCIHFGRCGGCDCQHLSYPRQTEHKERILRDTLSRVFDVSGVKFFGIKSGENPFFYRNKLQIPVVQGKNKILIGFFEKDSHRVVGMKKCLLHGDFADKTIAAVREYSEKFHISAYDERTGKGILRHIVARKIGGHTAVLIVINADELPSADGLSAILERNFEDFSLHISVNKKNTNVILSDNLKTLRGKFSVEYDAMGIKANISPLSFMQINDEVRDMIYRRVLDLANGEFADLTNGEASLSNVENSDDSDERKMRSDIIIDGFCGADKREIRSDIIIDAYSGGGLLTALLSKTAEKVYGIEIVGEAVNDADELFKRNGIKNAENIKGDTAEVLPKLIGKIKNEIKTDGKNIESCAAEILPKLIGKIERNKKITVILDPPRKGCERAVIDALNASEPEKIIYISCNPATLARDLALLKEKYDIISVYPYDMFPNTKHIETVVLLEFKKSQNK
jgi:23S rRNA (uracil1939-C5)-methyltransferase